MFLSYIAYMKNDAYQYNLKYGAKLLKHKYDDSSESDSDFDEASSNQMLSNFYTKAMAQVASKGNNQTMLEKIKNAKFFNPKKNKETLKM